MEAAQRKRVIGLAAACLAFAACSGPINESQAAAQTPPAAAVAEAPPPAAVPAAVEAPAAPPQLVCATAATQGGAILCHAPPGAKVALDGKPIAVADSEGVAVIGLKRDQKTPATVSLVGVKGGANPVIDVSPRIDTVSNLTMECNKIAAQTPEEKRKAEVSWVKKDKALKTFAPPLAPVAFAKPVEGVYSSSFGATRTYEPKTKDCKPTVNVHNGTDIAVPTGTEIRAPMAGTVILADPDLYYEGGCIFLDLGRGLVSVTMHMSRIDVKAGDVVKQGDLLGLSGATGRVTGPHVHWAIKYRNVLSDDRGTDVWLDPVLMMSLQQPKVSPP